MILSLEELNAFILLSFFMNRIIQKVSIVLYSEFHTTILYQQMATSTWKIIKNKMKRNQEWIKVLLCVLICIFGLEFLWWIAILSVISVYNEAPLRHKTDL